MNTKLRPLSVKMIVALDDANGIGKDGTLPWDVPLSGDLARFKALTIGRACVVGRKTWGHLIGVPGRAFFVVTRDRTLEAPGGLTAGTVPEAITTAHLEAGPEVWIIGGAQIYGQALDVHVQTNCIDEIHVTRVRGTHEADTFFPWEQTRLEAAFTCVVDVRGQDAGTRWEIWRRK